MKLPHWQHFLSLESDFINTIEYVELSEANSETHSIVYTKLLLAICSEVDVVAKLVCKKIEQSSTASNIGAYRSEITNKYQSFHTVECLIPRYDMVISPWLAWSGNGNPSWWKEHNDVKHSRSEHFQLANQKNVKAALAGLFTLLLYLYHEELYSGSLLPLPKLLDYEKMPGHLTVNPGAELPSIPRQ
ncbi:hypothetical protein [Vibrio jasicida]|uniref:hypothetical protein n=1 Tax=Vibrio jasicida TaxID=766224 RepID=UPI000CE4CB39|nr:hypothetical protein [Vibrio jasicida]